MSQPTEPVVARGGDRREGPRREADRALHYASENLTVTALAAAAEWGSGLELGMDALDRLVVVAAEFREARERAGILAEAGVTVAATP